MARSRTTTEAQFTVRRRPKIVLRNSLVENEGVQRNTMIMFFIEWQFFDLMLSF
jgi:hypothetical protein